MKTKFVIFLTILAVFLHPNHTYAAGSSLSFSPDSATFTVGETATTTIFLKTGGQKTIGVDLVLSYSPEIISIESVKKESAFDTLMAQKINNGAGLAQISLANAYNKFQTKNVEIATLTIKAKQPTEASFISFNAKRGNTTDTNVVNYLANDSLTSTEKFTFNVLAPPPTVTPNSSTPSQTATATPVPGSITVSPKPSPPRKKTGSVLESLAPIISPFKGKILGLSEEVPTKNPEKINPSSDSSLLSSLSYFFLFLIAMGIPLLTAYIIHMKRKPVLESPVVLKPLE